MTSADPLLIDSEGHTEFLLGNEAIARGAIEAGVGFACGYPGTPSTEVTDTFARLAPLLGIPFEYSVNEKIALEMAYAACLAGARSIVAMKHLGLMYAGDPLSTIPYVGTEAGMVIVSAGDPSAHTSPNEQDQRHLADALHIPMFDPSTPQEALEVTRFAFEMSERSRLPVIIRPTTRVCHTAAPVRFGAIERRPAPEFRRAPGRFLPLPPNARRMRVEINDRLLTAREMIDASGFFFRRGGGTAGVLASGAPAAICEELTRGVGPDFTFVSLTAVYPLPESWLIGVLSTLDTVLVVEELSPYLEDQLRALCSLHGVPTRILGKRTGHFPMEFEYEPRLISEVLADSFGLGSSLPPILQTSDLPQRAPTLCPACPHRSTFFAARSVFGDEALYFNDIGCYTLGVAPPLGVGDALVSMGAGFSLAAGVARTTGARTLGFLGDSTFFHSGMPALLNAVKENVNMVAVIMDNQVTAMTGFQESPGAAIADGQLVQKVDIEAIVRALGVRQVEVIDPNDLSAGMGAFERARQAEGLSVIISQRICPVFGDRALASTATAKTQDIEDAVDQAFDETATETVNEFASQLSRVSSAQVTPGVTTYRIDHTRCQHCGRTSCGQRCSQGIAIEFERAMAKARSLEIGEEKDRAPVAPCAEKCPLYLCIQGYAAHIAGGRYADALELIMDGLPLPDSVCRVCHRPCEEVCVRSGVDQPVAINDLKRFVMDWAAEQEEFPYQPRPAPHNGHRVAVVGAGPAGLAASHELALRGYRVTLLDSEDEPGGLLRYAIPPYRLPREVLDRDVQRILDLGVSFHGGRRLVVRRSNSDGVSPALDAPGCVENAHPSSPAATALFSLPDDADDSEIHPTYSTDTSLGQDLRLESLLSDNDVVLVALGAGDEIEIEIPGSGPQVIGGLTYLATEIPTPQRVVVVGGGNSAVDTARTALRRGADHVRIVCLEDQSEMPTIGTEVDAAVDEGVEICTGMRVTSLTAGGVEAQPVASIGGTSPDDYHPTGGPQEELPADLVILALGQQWTSPILHSDSWASNGNLRLEVDPESGQTSHERIFAAGDVTSGGSHVTDAIGAGLRAAWGIDRHLRGAEIADRRLPPPRVSQGRPVGRSGITRPDTSSRKTPAELDPATRTADFSEVVGVLTDHQARAEASRCMICGLCGNCNACLDLFGCPAFLVDDGLIEIDPNLCTACGVCAQLCPNGAIVPVFDPIPVSALANGAAV